ncbi:MAG: plasmid pRiA4b ORF-3 family protein, partial [Blastocatellia bacterium]
MIRLKYEPTIWRRVLLEGDTSLYILHHIIQATMGWENCHMHQFMVGGRYYGEPDGNLDFEDEGEVTISDLLPRARQKMDYEYDFGDSWLHEIRVEKLVPREDGARYPVCIAG